MEQLSKWVNGIQRSLLTISQIYHMLSFTTTQCSLWQSGLLSVRGGLCSPTIDTVRETSFHSNLSGPSKPLRGQVSTHSFSISGNHGIGGGGGSFTPSFSFSHSLIFLAFYFFNWLSLHFSPGLGTKWPTSVFRIRGIFTTSMEEKSLPLYLNWWSTTRNSRDPCKIKMGPL